LPYNRFSCRIKGLIGLLAGLFLMQTIRTVAAQPPPAILLPDLTATRPDAFATETITGAFPGMLLVPQEEPQDQDGKYAQSYHAACYVYVGVPKPGDPNGHVERYIRRFAVHAADRDTLPLTKRTARLLLLLYGENHARLHFDHPYNETVDVWLSRQSIPAGAGMDAAGEQFKNQIYLYNIAATRPPAEWAREIAHEFGHYALPGVSGFREPEEWANGVLGERLFLKWLHEDLRAALLKPDDIPFVTPLELGDYIGKQVTPLIRRIAFAHDSYDAAPLSRTDAVAMDNYTALALYLDTVYGSPMLLNALQYTEPKPGSTFVTAPDFLRGTLAALRGATELNITPPVFAGGHTVDNLLVYLPAGEWTGVPEGNLRTWEVRTEGRGIHAEGKSGLLITRPDWRRLSLTYNPATVQPPRLTLRKKESEIH
jgi:hypothetical protein